MGYLFFVGTILKFLLYLAVLRPMYLSDGLQTKGEVLMFFIGFMIALIFEAVYLSKLLRSKPKNLKE